MPTTHTRDSYPSGGPRGDLSLLAVPPPPTAPLARLRRCVRWACSRTVFLSHVHSYPCWLAIQSRTGRVRLFLSPVMKLVLCLLQARHLIRAVLTLLLWLSLLQVAPPSVDVASSDRGHVHP
jgi:hypothetical protein